MIKNLQCIYSSSRHNRRILNSRTHISGIIFDRNSCFRLMGKTIIIRYRNWEGRTWIYVEKEENQEGDWGKAQGKKSKRKRHFPAREVHA